MHGIQQLGELIETLPVLAGVLFALHDGFAQLLDVGHADVVKHRLALQAVFWHCRRRRAKEQLQVLITAESVGVPRFPGCGDASPSLTCAEKQQDLHAQILVVGDLQTNKLTGNLQHLLALVSHVG